jgi:uncharacterized membrane protein required for colicin V production
MSYFIAFLKHLNWIDLAVVIIFARILFISLKNGIGAEIFKVLGALLASYLSLHYYRTVAGYFTARLALDQTAVATVEFIVFAVFACLGYAFFSLLRLLLKRFMNMEVVPAISKFGGICLGIIRASLLASLLLYSLMVTVNPYMRKSIKSSFSGMQVVYCAPSVYGFFWHAVMSKLAPHEKFNSAVFEIEKDNIKKKK